MASPRYTLNIKPEDLQPEQPKHELSGIDTLFLSEHARYAKWELRNML